MEEVKLSPILLENKLNPNCYHYLSTHIKKITPGDLFEMNLYENLLLWAKEDDNIKWVCSKNRKKKILKDGLGRNFFGQIVYFVDYISFAEFDMLFLYNDILVNIEATVSTNNKILSQKYFKKIEKNHFILKKLYGIEKIITIFVLTEEPDEKISFPENTFYEVVDTSFEKLDFSNGNPTKIKRPIEKMYFKKYNTIGYHKEFVSFQKKFFYSFFNKDLEETQKMLSDSLYFERAFVGFIDRKRISCSLIPDNVEEVYFCLNEDKSLTMFFIDIDNIVYEILNKKGEYILEKKRSRYSRSRKMLLFLLKNNLIYKLRNNQIKRLKELYSAEFEQIIQ